MRIAAVVLSAVVLAPVATILAAGEAAPDEGTAPDKPSFHASVELKVNARWSQDDRFPLKAPFPPEFIPVGQPNVAMQTVSPGGSLEVSKATVYLDGRLPRSFAGHLKIDFIDLYDRNPTSTDKSVDVDEGWLLVGTRHESLMAITGTSFYALVGKAPKFQRQPFRRLESYGLVSTSFNRFPDLQLQVGGSLGSHVHFVGQVSNGNPTFFRDPNALAGDNGTDPPPNPDPKLHSGFPILYHAEVEDLEPDDKPEYGGGLGVQFLSADERRGFDLVGFYYETRLSKKARLNGTFYEGDLDLLDGVGVSLPIVGDKRTSYGANLDLRFGGLGAFAQAVKEELAGLGRKGFEIELGYRIVLGDLGDPRGLLPAMEPAVRYSRLDNDFTAPKGFVAPSMAWDWQKWDLGLRVTLIQKLDLCLEYSIHVIGASRPIHHDEFLGTLRFRY
jgi:hypothetical protein